MMENVRLVIVEDDWMIRDGLEALASSSGRIEVVATGSDGHEAVELATHFEPDVILMDIRMPNLDGLEATRRICRATPSVRVLVLTTFEDDDSILRALAAGASGYLTKDVAAGQLVQAITTAASGIVQFSPGVAARLVRDPSPVDDELRRAVTQLRPRQRDVLRRLASGATNREIGEQLHLSAGTVKNLVSSILRQLNLVDRTQAAVLAERCKVD